MKFKFLLTTSLLAAIFLMGCASFTKENYNSSNAPADPATQTFNDSTFADAVSSRNKNLCTYIEDEKMQKQCTDAIDAETLTKEALKDPDKSICEKIVLENYRKICEEKVDALIAENEKQAKEEEKNAEEAAKKRKIIDEDDLKACESLKAPHDIACKIDIINNRATAAQDTKICEQLEQTELIQLCKSNLNSISSGQEEQT